MMALRPLVRASLVGITKHKLRLVGAGAVSVSYATRRSPTQALHVQEDGVALFRPETTTLTLHMGRTLTTVTMHKTLWQRIVTVIRVIFHCGRLVLLGIPLVVTYPIARLRDAELADWWWRLALWTGQQSSPAVIKFLQWASTRRDMFSPKFCNTFQEFHAHCEVHSWEHTLDQLNESFGESWPSYMELDPSPIGSGVIAQVYQGRWKTTDEHIAVKVLHPNVVESVALDLDLLWAIASWIDLWLPNLSAKVGMQSFAQVMTSQLDLRIEANNLRRFQANFETNPSVNFPTPKGGFVTSSVLVESFVDGQPLTANSRDQRLAKTTIDTFLRMLFLHNFAHGDIHPGNILVTRQGIALLDAGIVNQLLPSDFQDFIALFHSIASKDGLAAGRILLEKSPRHHCTDEPAFCAAIASIVERATKNLNLNQVPVGDLLQEVLEVCQRHHVALQGRFVSIVVSIGVLEGVGRLLDPDLDILKIALPILVQAKFKQTL
ncbi:hypothetical protein AeNC1_001281 [Aphanomyces euteiches]|nr:hypothetical protein AeNC1_001281 [Aphanomyces euteiches]